MSQYIKFLKTDFSDEKFVIFQQNNYYWFMIKQFPTTSISYTVFIRYSLIKELNGTLNIIFKSDTYNQNKEKQTYICKV